MTVRASVCVVVSLSCGQALAQLSFTERSADAGCAHAHVMARDNTGLEFQAAGGAVGDFNRDGHQDLFILGGSGGFDRLFINDGQGGFNDVSLGAGVSRTHQGTGVAVADYNNDGRLDIFVTSLGPAAAGDAGLEHPVPQQRGRDLHGRDAGGGGAVQQLPGRRRVRGLVRRL